MVLVTTGVALAVSLGLLFVLVVRPSARPVAGRRGVRRLARATSSSRWSCARRTRSAQMAAAFRDMIAYMREMAEVAERDGERRPDA